MAGNEKLVYTISKTAANYVRDGKAVIDSGGVRWLDGRILELAKPAVSSITGNLTSPIALMSSLVGNVQSGFIQNGVNQANTKLDLSLEKLDQIQNAVNGLAKSNVLGWVNCGFSMANFGISVAGICMILEKLNKISLQINDLTSKVDRKIKGDYLEKFDCYRFYIKSDIQALDKSDIAVNLNEISIRMGEIAAFLKRIIREFNNKEIDGMLGCSIIFNLSIAFAQELRKYSAQYFYQNGQYPANYEEWVQILYSIDSDTFKEHLKQILIFDCIDISMREKYSAFGGVVYGIEYQLGSLEYTKKLVMRIEQKDYLRMDHILTGRVKSNNFFESNGRVCIPV